MKKIAVSLTILGAFLVSASSTFAADIVITISPPSNLLTTSFGRLLTGVIGFILVVAALAAFIYLIWGGVQWITSGGDKAAVESARSRIFAAIMGLFVVFATWAIMNIVGQFFGFDISNLKLPAGY